MMKKTNVASLFTALGTAKHTALYYWSCLLLSGAERSRSDCGHHLWRRLAFVLRLLLRARVSDVYKYLEHLPDGTRGLASY